MVNPKSVEIYKLNDPETANALAQYFNSMSETDKNLTEPTYYDNSKGSLYKIAEQRGWSPYTFDVVKRLDRGGKKDPLRQEIEKSIVVLQLWLKELEE